MGLRLRFWGDESRGKSVYAKMIWPSRIPSLDQVPVVAIIAAKEQDGWMDGLERSVHSLSSFLLPGIRLHIVQSVHKQSITIHPRDKKVIVHGRVSDISTSCRPSLGL